MLLKDLNNISTRFKSGNSRNDLDESVWKLKVTHGEREGENVIYIFCSGASVEVLVSESSVLMGIYFQDEEMKQIFSSYPELVCVDATYKLLELCFPVYIMLVEDGNGQGKISAAFLLMEETEQSIRSMITILKSRILSGKSPVS